MKHLKLKKHGTTGELVTFCGLDGCGKSTMIELLLQETKALGKEVLLTRQPTLELRQSKIFRSYMDEADHSNYDYRALSLMAAADRIQHVHKVIMPALEAGKTVICDRYFYSCLANLRARGYKKDQWIYEIAKEFPEPDFAIFLDVPVEIAVSRVRARPEERNRYIDMSLQYALHSEYRNICKENGGFLIKSVGTVEETYSALCQVMKLKRAAER